MVLVGLLPRSSPSPTATTCRTSRAARSANCRCARPHPDQRACPRWEWEHPRRAVGRAVGHDPDHPRGCELRTASRSAVRSLRPDRFRGAAAPMRQIPPAPHPVARSAARRQGSSPRSRRCWGHPADCPLWPPELPVAAGTDRPASGRLGRSHTGPGPCRTSSTTALWPLGTPPPRLPAP